MHSSCPGRKEPARGAYAFQPLINSEQEQKRFRTLYFETGAQNSAGSIAPGAALRFQGIRHPRQEPRKEKYWSEGSQDMKESKIQLRLEEMLEEDTAVQSGRLPFENLLLILALLIGTALLLYPSAADYWNSFHQSRTVMRYADFVASMTEQQYEEAIANAEAYNRKISDKGIEWVMDPEQRKVYESLLNFDGTGVMGYIDVPKLRVKLPIYHGTSQEVLQISIGHLEQTSLPVGGEGSHCSLSGHRGLPSAKLFSELDLMAEGDTFTLSILNETYTYEVDQIRVVEPKDMRDLDIVPGKDLCTLITCTPYGVNSHRLLVRGHRTENVHGNARVVADAMQLDPVFVAPFIMIPLLLGLMLAMVAGPGET